MELIINGERKELDVAKVSDVIRHYGFENKLVVVEIEGTIIHREEWSLTALKPGVKLELVHFVGGG